MSPSLTLPIRPGITAVCITISLELMAVEPVRQAASAAPQTGAVEDRPGAAIHATLLQPRQLELRFLPDFTGTGREHSFTDAGFGLPAPPPTAFEQAKLDLARAAVEASRRAGTLHLPFLEEPRLGLRPFDLEWKVARLRSWQPAILRPDVAAGLAPGHAPIQRMGPSGLTALEIAKLKGLPLPTRTSANPPSAQKEPGAGDGSPTQQASPARDDGRP